MLRRIQLVLQPLLHQLLPAVLQLHKLLRGSPRLLHLMRQSAVLLKLLGLLLIRQVTNNDASDLAIVRFNSGSCRNQPDTTLFALVGLFLCTVLRTSTNSSNYNFKGE